MTANFSVRRNTDRIWRMEQFHFHHEYEILFSLTDNGEFFLSDRRYRLAKGSLLLLSPDALHRSVAEDNRIYDRWVVHFSASFAQQFSTPQTDLLAAFRHGIPYRLLSPQQEEQFLLLFKQCAAQNPDFGSDVTRTISFIQLLLEINRLPAHAASDIPPESTLAPILRYIRNNPENDLSLPALSARFFLSRSQLCRRFRAETGFSPTEYIIRSRIIRACALLEAGSSVQEAGTRAGFGDHSHFIRTFHTIIGQPPGRYAKTRRETNKINNINSGGTEPPVKG